MNLEKVITKVFPPIEELATRRDCMLFALGLGIGARNDAPGDLQFCYEDGLKMFPAMTNVIAQPGSWTMDPALGIDWVKILHGEQSFVLHGPLYPGRAYVGSLRVVGVIDKGVDKGAMLYLEKQLRERDRDQVVSTVASTYVLRGDGGCGSTMNRAPPVHPISERAPDARIELPTLPQAALLYRLSGDYHPIHASPAVAQKAGFDRPILHGLCTMGVATRAILSAFCDDVPERLRSVSVRFSAPVYPGETIVTDCWRDGKSVIFRTSVAERNKVVLNNCRAELLD